MSDRILFILIGTAAMLVLSLLRRKKYEISLWKAIVIPFALTVFGVAGTMVLAFIESGAWGGISFYGSVFLIPVGMFFFSLLIREKYSHVLDFSVTQICAMLAVMKVLCLKSGCCYGIMITESFQFPSQIVEVITGFGLMVLFLILEVKGMFKGELYPLYFLVYGGMRFVLNFFRGGISPFVWILPAGHFWSIIAMIIGFTTLMIMEKRRTESNEIEENTIE